MEGGFVDKSTGLIHPSETPFVKVYWGNLNQLTGITGKEYQVFGLLAEKMDERNVIGIGDKLKRAFIAQHKTSLSTFNNTISSLAKKGLIKRVENMKGVYIVNPKYAAKAEYSKVVNINF
ncbi:TPA: replication/maintenance protein RepL [Vibrio parahaemolyticus]|uniref:replication/maintenance protein RepL n=1 Tax=Vibrio parahaemolyticus TaxID=670 RepID=UPI000A39AC8C|nr:replication/maintenance protein RepL [Vibrio parahaemolyticus]EGQ8030303.1 hypothetical protein [Vibrio parahaemolyticus]OUJ46279.1 hypothetical protein BTZ53_10705 [Vibrio parahaemolyticus]HCG6030329.1 replication/maintenance protein RepL [Vibrio parahaemolyticus]HCG6035076.1 replication/maintenance protein RepL [Vibrio parahaemolyticus]HDF8527471.1 replication/maintenance protein RepL [Vibrio parahaemolyticus]